MAARVAMSGFPQGEGLTSPAGLGKFQGSSGKFWGQVWETSGEPLESLTFFHADFGKEFPSRTLERSIPELPLSKLCAVPFALQNRALFEGEKMARKCAEKRGGRGVASKGGKKEKRDA